MTPEGKVKDKVKKLLSAYGAWYHMPVQNGMGKPTLDFTICFCGRFLAVETKAPGEVPTKRQEQTMKEIRALRAGGVALVVDGDYAELEVWLMRTLFDTYQGEKE